MLSRNSKRVPINFWRLKLGIIAVLLLLLTCCATIFTWYPFALFSNLGAVFVAIAASVTFGIVNEFIKAVRTLDNVLHFLHGILACIAALALLIAIVGPIFSQPKHLAVASLNNQQFQLVYTTNCFEYCTGYLVLHRCEFFDSCPEFDKTSAYVGWFVSFSKINPALWELSNEVKVVSLSIDPASGGINVSYDGKVVHTFKSP